MEQMKCVNCGAMLHIDFKVKKCVNCGLAIDKKEDKKKKNKHIFMK